MPPPFELIARELRAQGIIIARLPDEYRVNYLNGSEATAASREDLDEALALAQIMAQSAPAAAAREAAAYRPPRRKRMTPKAIRRRMILAHNYRMRARTIRQQREKKEPGIMEGPVEAKIASHSRRFTPREMARRSACSLRRRFSFRAPAPPLPAIEDAWTGVNPPHRAPEDHPRFAPR